MPFSQTIASEKSIVSLHGKFFRLYKIRESNFFKASSLRTFSQNLIDKFLSDEMNMLLYNTNNNEQNL